MRFPTDLLQRFKFNENPPDTPANAPEALQPERGFTPYMRLRAFTTYEMLTVLVIIGTLSLYVVPGVWHNAETIKRKAILEKTTIMLNDYFTRELFEDTEALVQDAAWVNGRWAKMKYLVQHVKACDGEGEAACASPGATDGGGALSGRGLVLNTGAHVYELFDNISVADNIYVDVNGLAEPNVDCEDRFPLNHNHTTGEVSYVGCSETFVR
jgi:hypothetical protein